VKEREARHFACFLSGLSGLPPTPPPTFSDVPTAIILWNEARDARLEEGLRSERYGLMNSWGARMYNTHAQYMNVDSDDDSDDY